MHHGSRLRLKGTQLGLDCSSGMLTRQGMKHCKYVKGHYIYTV